MRFPPAGKPRTSPFFITLRRWMSPLQSREYMSEVTIESGIGQATAASAQFILDVFSFAVGRACAGKATAPFR